MSGSNFDFLPLARPQLALHGGGGGGHGGHGGFAGGAGPGFTGSSGGGGGLDRAGVIALLSLLALGITFFALAVAHEAMALVVIALVLFGVPFAAGCLMALLLMGRELLSASTATAMRDLRSRPAPFHAPQPCPNGISSTIDGYNHSKGRSLPPPQLAGIILKDFPVLKDLRRYGVANPSRPENLTVK
jgi:hypothetical protein